MLRVNRKAMHTIKDGTWSFLKVTVFLRISPSKEIMRFGKSGKLVPKYILSFEILERDDTTAYRVALPPTLSCIHNILHISILRSMYQTFLIYWSMNQWRYKKTWLMTSNMSRSLIEKSRPWVTSQYTLVKGSMEESFVEKATWEREQEMRETSCFVLVNLHAQI